jgi:hypothetical protein
MGLNRYPGNKNRIPRIGRAKELKKHRAISNHSYASTREDEMKEWREISIKVSLLRKI